jgi:hypothetical protein
MDRFGRWAVAALATAAAFVLPTWICGALVLPSMLEDPSIRWGLACALGTALAALAAAWGYGFAARTQEKARDKEPSGPMNLASGARAVAVGGSNPGSISTGDTTAPHQPFGQVSSEKPAGPQLPAAPVASRVTASGERSIAIGGGNKGQLSTGDQHDDAQS